MSEQEQSETLLEFPCDFAIKAMGEASEELDSIVVEIVRRHVDDIGAPPVRYVIGLIRHTTPSCFNFSRSARLIPSLPQISVLCSPKTGGGVATVGAVPSIFTPVVAT